jgi:hypothetical protein
MKGGILNPVSLPNRRVKIPLVGAGFRFKSGEAIAA